MENNKRKKITVGGVALFNGIIFTSDYRQVAVQKEGEKINSRCTNLTRDKRIISKIPVIRGLLGLGNQIGNSIPDFMRSSGEEEKSSKLNTLLLYAILIVACISIPVLISAFFPVKYQSIIQALIIALEFAMYICMLKSIPDLDTLFKYHGAEHKAVNAYENLKLEEINLENVRKQSRFHKRCGGNFIVYFVILTMLTTLLPIENFIIKALSMMLLCIFNIGLAYEVVNLFSKFKKPFDIINYPATLIQFFTTKEPTDEMLKLAIYGVLGSTRKENGITPLEYLKKYTSENLKNKEYETTDIYSILEYVTGVDRNRLLLQKDRYLITLNNEIEADRLLNKYYNENYPLQYITHKQYFYNELYYVDENVLIPRADSEILVEKAIEYIKKEELKSAIDPCTGSGALGISTARNSDIETMTLIDISLGAISVANKNILSNDVGLKVKTKVSDLLSEIIKETATDEEKKVDIIISNPPYIKTEVISTLQKEVQKEPHLALDGGKDGLDFYIRIFKEAKEVLKPNGLLMLEIGYDQLDDIKNIVKENSEYTLLESVKDYGGNDRVVVCRFQEK